MKNQQLYNKIKALKTRSAWDNGVKKYALELIEDLEGEITITNLETTLLSGAEDWQKYSWGGCSLIYNEDIAKRLCTKSELKKTDNGRLNPNKNREWLDVQARALYQASQLISRELEERDKR